jgi:hypothetical protein
MREALTDREGAERLAGDVEAAITKLEGALEAETALLARDASATGWRVRTRKRT